MHSYWFPSFKNGDGQNKRICNNFTKSSIINKEINKKKSTKSSIGGLVVKMPFVSLCSNFKKVFLGNWMDLSLNHVF